MFVVGVEELSSRELNMNKTIAENRPEDLTSGMFFILLRIHKAIISLKPTYNWYLYYLLNKKNILYMKHAEQWKLELNYNTIRYATL